MRNKPIILASNSPRRKELLEQGGIHFSVKTCTIDENISLTNPQQLVERLSFLKAFPVMTKNPGSIVIGADTVVSLQNVILTKPQNEADALQMLQNLSGKEHEVYTGITIFTGDRNNPQHCITFSECTKVKMFENETDLLKEYVATGEPMDKAGAYGIQGMGALLVERIEGDYNTVVGLPLARLCRTLRAL